MKSIFFKIGCGNMGNVKYLAIIENYVYNKLKMKRKRCFPIELRMTHLNRPNLEKTKFLMLGFFVGF